jgi:hypothetical protein
MGYRRELLLLMPALASIFFIIDSNVFLSSNVQAQRQSQSTTSVCNGDTGSCFTTICPNDQPCQTFSSDQPFFEQPAKDPVTMQPVERIPAIVPPAEESIVTQPVGETSEIMQPEEETIVMQPVQVTEQYKEATHEVCDDGLDNDNDGGVDSQDEDCNATTFSSTSPMQEPLMSDNTKVEENNEQHSDDSGFEQPTEKGDHDDESGQDDDGGEDEDEDEDNEQQHDEDSE